ncbi:uncharacterized protein LOC126153038 [Schistocerca cancellata]|uniref:uncharacterized protein LOC126153038 n=1 Tax=Schistocerca cancellata TaxID=274614 RepID=UPI0021173E1A|nr:uncharacterized protein LOC126153038 [Schistocerca cancellata]
MRHALGSDWRTPPAETNALSRSLEIAGSRQGSSSRRGPSLAGMVWRPIQTVALLLLLSSTTGSRATPEENAVCLTLMARLESVRWWCRQPRLPGNIVNSVRACIQRNEFVRELPSNNTNHDELIIGFSSKHLRGALISSIWTTCHAEDGGWSKEPKAYFGTVTLEGEASGQQEYRLWYAADSHHQCWERTYKKFIPEIKRGQFTEPYLYECGRCTFQDNDSGSGEDKESDKYSYVRGFNSTVYYRRKCGTAKGPYVPALYRVRGEVTSCFECLLWSEIRALQPVFLGYCWAEVNGRYVDTKYPRTLAGGLVTRDNRTLLCMRDGSVLYWNDLENHVLFVHQQPGVTVNNSHLSFSTTPSPRIRVQNSSRVTEASVSVQEALATLNPSNFQPPIVRTGSTTPSPQTLVSCLDTILVESSTLSQSQISQSLKGFEMYAATIPLTGTARANRLLTTKGNRATLLVAEKVQGAVVSADGAEVVALDAQKDGSSATSLTSRSDVSAAVLSAAAAKAARLAFTYFRRAGVGVAFQQLGYVLNSDVISVQIINTTTDDERYVDIVLRPTHGGVRRRCGLWDLERNVWDFSLCSLQFRGEVSDVCRCRHLTHFAQLVTDADLQWGGHAGALEALSLAGVCASLLGAAGLGAAAALAPEWRSKPG